MKKPLTDLQLRKLKVGSHADPGCPNLYLNVGPTGSRSWVFKFNRKIDGVQVRRNLGLGPLHAVSLADARKKADGMRALLYSGVDPLAAKRKAIAAVIPTFRETALALIAKEAPAWKNKKHEQQWRNTLEVYVYPSMGNMPVNLVTAQHVLNVLTAGNLWTAKTETATRLRGRIEMVLSFAAALGHHPGPNPASWDILKHTLPAAKKIQNRRLMPALPYRRIHEFMKAIQGREGASAVALRFTVLTAARSGAVRKANWSEIDFEAKIWTSPPEHMKGGREHRVPLSSGALKLLESIRPENPEGLIFKGRIGGPLSDMSLTKVIRSLPGSWTDPKQHDALVVVHGFRSSFRDWGSEVAGADHSVLESALAHVSGDATVRSYARSDLLDARRDLMEQWSKFILG